MKCLEITLTKILSMGPEGLALASISQSFAYLFEINEIISNRQCFVSTGSCQVADHRLHLRLRTTKFIVLVR